MPNKPTQKDLALIAEELGLSRDPDHERRASPRALENAARLAVAAYERYPDFPVDGGPGTLLSLISGGAESKARALGIYELPLPGVINPQGHDHGATYEQILQHETIRDALRKAGAPLGPNPEPHASSARRAQLTATEVEELTTATRSTLTIAEADEVRELLAAFPDARLAVQRTTVARFRTLGIPFDGIPALQAFDELVDADVLRVSDSGTATAMISRHPSGRVFRVAVGVKGHPVAPDWNAFEQSFQWFGQPPRSIASGDHLFALAVDRWRSAVVGLYEAVSAGAATLPGSPDAERWPWAVGVRPLAAIPPTIADRIEGLYGPQSGLPASVPDDQVVSELYAAVRNSPRPPGPANLEQRIQELEPIDVAEDVVEAVRLLDREARRPAVLDLAVELGAWSEAELEVRAWYTGTGDRSHVRNILGKALEREVGLTRRLSQVHGRYSERDGTDDQFGSTYRRAANREPASDRLPATVTDLVALDRATRRHMEMQDDLAAELRKHGIEPRSPRPRQPQFDLAFESRGKRFVVEAKSSNPVSAQQVRLGAGQVMEYRHVLGQQTDQEVMPILLLEGEPPAPWADVCTGIGLGIIRCDLLDETLRAILES